MTKYRGKGINWNCSHCKHFERRLNSETGLCKKKGEETKKYLVLMCNELPIKKETGQKSLKFE